MTVAAENAAGPDGFDLSPFVARNVSSIGCEHARLVIAGEAFRLDAVAATLVEGPVRLTYRIAQTGWLERQIETLQRLEARLAGVVPDQTGAAWLYRRLTALQAWDARSCGASLRDIANLLCGPEEWPGPGEYRKSAARRLVAMGEELMIAGPRPLLLER